MKKIIFLSITLMLLISNMAIGQEKKFIKKVVESYNEKKYIEAEKELKEFVQKNGSTTYTKYWEALLSYQIDVGNMINTCYKILVDFTESDPQNPKVPNPKNINEKDFTFEPEIGNQLFPGFYSSINGKYELNMTKGKAYMDKYKYTCWYIFSEREYPDLLKKALNGDDLDVMYKISGYDAFNDLDYIKNETFYKGNFKVPAKDVKAVEDRIPYVEQNYIKKGIGKYIHILNIRDNFYKITNMEVGEILLNKMKEKMVTDFEKYKISNDSLIKVVNMKIPIWSFYGKEPVVSIGWFYDLNDFMVRKLGNSHSIKSDIDKYKDKAATILWDSQKEKWNPEYENAKTENTIEAINAFINKWGNDPYDNVAEISKAKELLADLRTKKEQQELNRAEKEAAEAFAAEEARKELIINEMGNILTYNELNLKMNEILPNATILYKGSSNNPFNMDLTDKYLNLYKEDIINYFNLKQYDSELKIKVFKQSTEYNDYLSKLRNDKAELCYLNLMYFDSKGYLNPQTKLEMIKYDIAKKQFKIEVYSYNDGIGGNKASRLFGKPIVKELLDYFKLDKLPISNEKQSGYLGSQKINYETKYLTIGMNEASALKVEENKTNLELGVLFKPTGAQTNPETNYPWLTTGNIRLFLFNKATGEIYFTKLYGTIKPKPVEVKKENVQNDKNTETKNTANEKIGTGVITGGQMDSGGGIIFIENEQKENSTFRIDVETLNGIPIFIANPDNESGYFNEKVISKKVKFTYKKFKDDLGNEFDVIKKIELIK